MEDTTKTVVTTLATGLVKKILIAGGTAAATHGLISGVSSEAYAGLATFIVASGFSLWQDYGKAIVLSQLEVLKARSLAAAAKIHAAGLPPVSVAEIAAQSPKLDEKTVVKVAEAMPADVKASVLPVTGAGAKIVILGLALALGAMLALPGDARAQGQPRRAPAAIAAPSQNFQPTGDLVGDIKRANQQNASTGSADAGQDLIKKIIALAGPDIDYAIALATAANTASSKVRLQCLQAIKDFNTQASGKNVRDASGNVMTEPDPHLFTTFEQVAEGIDSLSPTGPLFTSCAGVAGMLRMDVVQAINAVISGTAAAALVIPK